MMACSMATGWNCLVVLVRKKLGNGWEVGWVEDERGWVEEDDGTE